MNYIERFVDRKIKRIAWKSTILDNFFSNCKAEKKINKYRWIIKDNNENII